MWKCLKPARHGVGAGAQRASPSMFCIMAVGIKCGRYVAPAAVAWSALTSAPFRALVKVFARQIQVILAALALMVRQQFTFISNPRDTCGAILCISSSQPLRLWRRLKRLSRSRRHFLAGWLGRGVGVHWNVGSRLHLWGTSAGILRTVRARGLLC